MTDIQQAREWAAEITESRQTNIRPDAFAAAEVIQSLPDHWIDADKVREVLDRWAENPFPTSDEVAVLNDFEALLTPPLPTLADMTAEEQEACQWMQAQVFPTATTLGIITGVDEYAHSAIILFADGMAKNVPWAFITPRPDLPKLEWPGRHADTITAESVEDVRAGRDADFEPALPRPSQVPMGEPWKVAYEGRTWTGVLVNPEGRGDVYWSLSRWDEGLSAKVNDVTLVSRLVPEVTP